MARGKPLHIYQCTFHISYMFIESTDVLLTLQQSWTRIDATLFYLSGFDPFVLSCYATDVQQRAKKREQTQQLANLGHAVVDTFSKRKKICVQCLKNNVRAPSGERVRVRQQCGTCNVPLCVGFRTCFVDFHKALLDKHS